MNTEGFVLCCALAFSNHRLSVQSTPDLALTAGALRLNFAKSAVDGMAAVHFHEPDLEPFTLLDWIEHLKITHGITRFQMAAASELAGSVHVNAQRGGIAVPGRLLAGIVPYQSNVLLAVSQDKARAYDLQTTQQKFDFNFNGEYAQPPRKDFAPLKSELESALRQIRDFAKKDRELKTWADYFERVRVALEGQEVPPPLYLPTFDQALDRLYSAESAKLLKILARADVFGGMGSWNNAAPDSAEGEEASERLFQAIRAAFPVACNADFMR